MTPSLDQGIVSLIGSPIGNLGDITIRAIDTLKNADIIACEDTRHSSRLLFHLEIRDKHLVSLHEHNETERAPELVERAAAGQKIAVLTDAGTPSISDPGYRLVNACIEVGVQVEVVPGPSAIITGLVGSGLPTDAFYFGGFLPVKSGRKHRELTAALERSETSIFYESPHRLLKTLAAIDEMDPDRSLCVARELTKKFESYHRGTARQICEEFADRSVKGEITLLIRGAGKKKTRDAREKGGLKKN